MYKIYFLPTIFDHWCFSIISNGRIFREGGGKQYSKGIFIQACKLYNVIASYIIYIKKMYNDFLYYMDIYFILYGR
jgi:hypothetical protein